MGAKGFCAPISRSIVLEEKKNKIVPFVATWMDPEIIILSEVSQKKTNAM